jgi:hypothetical protein
MTEPGLAITWALGVLNADPTFCGLVAGGQAYEVLPNAADTTSQPGVAVGIQAVAPPTGAIRTGSRTWSEQTVTLRVAISQRTTAALGMLQTRRTEPIEAIKTQVLILLDGLIRQALAGGMVWECSYYTTPPDVVQDDGDWTIITGTLWFTVSLKAA